MTVTPAYPKSLGWTFVSSGEISLASFAGGKIKVAFKYSSTEAKAGTWEVKNVLVSATKAEAPELPSGLTGNGTEANPFTVDDAFTIYASGTVVKGWFKGEIIGTYSNAGLAAGSNTEEATNIVIGTAAKHVPVQLPGGDIRTALNLVDNPQNLNKTIMIEGSLEAYFKVAGIKNLTDYKIL